MTSLLNNYSVLSIVSKFSKDGCEDLCSCVFKYSDIFETRCE